MSQLQSIKDSMSSLEISELTNKRHADLMRDIRNMEPAWENIAQRKFALGYYTDPNNQQRPMYQLSKTECLYIATKFNDEARARLIIRWQELEQQQSQPISIEDSIIAQLQVTKKLRLEQEAINNRLLLVEAKVQTRPDYFTIVGYATLNGVSCNLKHASSLGRQATAMCKQLGLEMDEIPDPRFGKVKLYPTTVLDSIFTSNLATL